MAVTFANSYGQLPHSGGHLCISRRLESSYIGSGYQGVEWWAMIGEFDICKGWTLGISEWLPLCNLIRETNVWVTPAKDIVEVDHMYIKSGGYCIRHQNNAHI